MTQRHLLYGVLLLIVIWMIVSTVLLFGWFFPFVWMLPVLVAARNWQTAEEAARRKPRKRATEADWAPERLFLREPEFLETADGERLRIVEDDGSASFPHLLAG